MLLLVLITAAMMTTWGAPTVSHLETAVMRFVDRFSQFDYLYIADAGEDQHSNIDEEVSPALNDKNNSRHK